MIKVYGIKNCNTVKKALDWLNANEMEYEFHDLKKLGVDREKLEEWSALVGWEELFNKKGTTWRALPEEEKASAADKEGAFNLMERKTSVIKRPVLEKDGRILQGYDEDGLKVFFGK